MIIFLLRVRILYIIGGKTYFGDFSPFDFSLNRNEQIFIFCPQIESKGKLLA